MWEDQLAKLREQFPPERIEKLPKPMWRGAWDTETKSNCPECGGYHPRANTIHLDYVGHANCTDRLLDVDPLWDWEPLAYTEAGLPLFDKVGGLWIRLTICGVTRLGYGDGNSPKEIIGDAIRNAAMRFGVALDLWAKINLHEERNPGDGPTPTQGRRPNATGPAGAARQGESQSQQDVHQAPSANQDALDSLGSVCDENGYDRRTMRDRYTAWVGNLAASDTKIVVTDLLDAPEDQVIAFAAHLIEILDAPDGDNGGPGGGDSVAADQDRGAGADADDAAAEIRDGGAEAEDSDPGVENATDPGAPAPEQAAGAAESGPAAEAGADRGTTGRTVGTGADEAQSDLF